MIRTAVLVCALALLHHLATAAIVFSTQEQEQLLEGVKLKQLLFKDGKKTICYQPPRGWTVFGGSAGIRLVPRDLAQAHAQIDQSPLSEPQNFDPEVISALQRTTLASVPPESQKVALVSEEINPLLVNGHQTYAATVSYEAYGQEFITSVLYLNLPDSQVRFRTTACKRDFAKVHGAFRSSIFSWQWKQ